MLEGTQYTVCTCFTIWQDQIWVGTNRGSVSVIDSQLGTRIADISFSGNSKRQVEIKHLAVSSEEEVNRMIGSCMYGLCSRVSSVSIKHQLTLISSRSLCYS